ncbi:MULTISPECIES: condensation domain-containing protein [unclassified Streptomyces]|uniref:condensation domain-containing protein n=1 Tax=unclassified Streptomyces TaxID=2593676 RepID=UPI0033A9579B
MAPGRHIGRNPLFQAAFVLQNTDNETLHLPGIDCTIFEPAAGTAKFDLTLTLEEEAGGAFTGTLEYAAELFDTASAKALADSFHHLLAHAVTAPDTPLDRLRLSDTDETGTPHPARPRPTRPGHAPPGPATPRPARRPTTPAPSSPCSSSRRPAHRTPGP